MALFDRAEARDFANVYELLRQFPKATLLERAAEIDAGFDRSVLAQMLLSLTRFTDDELPVPATQRQAVRDFFAKWTAELRAE